MDSLRKRVSVTPKTSPAPARLPSSIPPKKREELFISRAEAQHMEKHEKKFQKGIKLKKILGFIFIFLLIVIIVLVSYFFWKTYSVSRKMNSESSIQTTLTQSVRALASPILSKNEISLKGQESGRINILLLGAAGQNKPGGNLTDTVMVMSIDIESKKVALLSLPRDFYAPIPDSTSFAKINSLYPIGIKNGSGIELAKGAVEKITGININYYVVVDFDAFEKIIDNIGGINIVSERDIYDATYPGPNYSYETFKLSKALKYVRERHDDPEGDFGRAKRQQQVIQAVKNKLFSLQTFFNIITLNNILTTLGDNIKTDISLTDLESFISLSKTIDLENIGNVVVDAWKKDSLLKVSHVQTEKGNAFILIPRVGNYSEIQDISKNIFNQEEIKRRRELIASEDATIGIINRSGDSELEIKIKSLLSDRLDLKNIHTVSISEDADTVFNDTVVLQKPNAEKIFTLDELIKKIPAKLSDISLPEQDGGDDLLIILGSDLIETYKYDEDSIEDFNKSQDAPANLL